MKIFKEKFFEKAVDVGPEGKAMCVGKMENIVFKKRTEIKKQLSNNINHASVVKFVIFAMIVYSMFLIGIPVQDVGFPTKFSQFPREIPCIIKTQSYEKDSAFVFILFH